jgi:hypothetical protein
VYQFDFSAQFAIDKAQIGYDVVMDPTTTNRLSALLDGLQRFLDAPDWDVKVAIVDGQYAVQIVRPDSHSTDADQSPGGSLAREPWIV